MNTSSDTSGKSSRVAWMVALSLISPLLLALMFPRLLSWKRISIKLDPCANGQLEDRGAYQRWHVPSQTSLTAGEECWINMPNLCLLRSYLMYWIELGQLDPVLEIRGPES